MMKIFWMILGVAAGILLLLLGLTYLCFTLCFYVSKRERKREREKAYHLPSGKLYEPYHADLMAWQDQVRAMPCEDMTVTSFDGLKLCGRYYEYEKGAPIELMFHGYRSCSEGDLSLGVLRCFALKRSALVVDHRASGRSEGNVISFGINESRDCLSWLALMEERFGKDVKILLTGISMGAATVMMASSKELPENVVGVLADCGYTSAKAIIKKVIRSMKLPANLLYPFVKLGARIFGHFDLEEDSPIESVQKSRVPILFVHGDTDAFVPCYMSEENYKACTSDKNLVIVPGAGHGLCYPVGKQSYLDALQNFFEPYLEG